MKSALVIQRGFHTVLAGKRQCLSSSVSDWWIRCERPAVTRLWVSSFDWQLARISPQLTQLYTCTRSIHVDSTVLMSEGSRCWWESIKMSWLSYQRNSGNRACQVKQVDAWPLGCCDTRPSWIITDYRLSEICWWCVFDNVCRMGRWSFWRWFDVINQSTFNEDMRKKWFVIPSDLDIWPSYLKLTPIVTLSSAMFPLNLKGVPRRQPHRRSGLSTLPSVEAIP